MATSSRLQPLERTALSGFTKVAFTFSNSFSLDIFSAIRNRSTINYRVENLDALAETLRKEKVTILDQIETFDYGKFVHILDIEGNKIQLWEPFD